MENKLTEADYLEAFERFWASYPRKVCKGQARKIWLKLTKGMNEEDLQAFSEKLILAIDSQIRKAYRLREKGDFVADWKHPSTWLHGECWLDDVNDISEKKPTSPILRECSIPGCDAYIHGSNFNYCQYHLGRKQDRFKQKKHDFMAEHDLLPQPGESSYDYAMRCKAACKQYLKNIKYVGKSHEPN